MPLGQNVFRRLVDGSKRIGNDNIYVSEDPGEQVRNSIYIYISLLRDALMVTNRKFMKHTYSCSLN